MCESTIVLSLDASLSPVVSVTHMVTTRVVIAKCHTSIGWSVSSNKRHNRTLMPSDTCHVEITTDRNPIPHAQEVPLLFVFCVSNKNGHVISAVFTSESSHRGGISIANIIISSMGIFIGDETRRCCFTRGCFKECSGDGTVAFHKAWVYQREQHKG